VGLPTLEKSQGDNFEDNSVDPENYRIELRKRSEAPRILAMLEVYRDNVKIDSQPIMLNRVPGLGWRTKYFRSPWLRFVSDDVDDQASGYGAGTPANPNDPHHQTIKVKLGDTVKIWSGDMTLSQ